MGELDATGRVDVRLASSGDSSFQSDAFEETAYLFLGLYHGKSPGAEALSAQEEREAEFVLSAPFTNWRRVIEGELDPIQGMMTKKLKVKGNMMKIMRYPKAAKEIVSCCALVPTDFGD